jgi:arylsulfatase A-like enzyme
LSRLVLQYLPFALACLGLKALRTVALVGADPWSLLDSLGVELGLHACLVGAAGLWLAIRPGRGTHRSVGVGLSVAGFLLFLLEGVAVTFALETGTPLDHHLFRFGLVQLIAVWPLIRAEVSTRKLVSVSLFASALLGLRSLQIWRGPVVEVRRRPALLWIAAGALLLALLPLRLPRTVATSMPVELALGRVLAPVEAAEPDEVRLPRLSRDGRLVPAESDRAFEHVVVVALESTSWFATSLAEDGPPTTPFLASLAERGALFERAYAVVPHSSKAFVAMHCGVAPYLLMRVRESEPGGVPVRCLPDLLREQGFQTLYFGSHVGGFESWRRLAKNLGFAVTLTAEQLDTRRFEPVNYFSYEDEILLEPTREWLARFSKARDEAARDGQRRRLYAFYLTSAAHHDYRLPARHTTQRYSDDERRDRYLNAVRYQDRFLEQLFLLYREAGLYEDTLFVVLGDHGEAFGEHGRRLHDHVIYEEGIRVPLVFFGRGIEPERRRDPVSQLDLMPTLLRFAGFRLEGAPQDGMDAFARGPEDAVYASCWYSERCLARITRERKWISHFGHAPPQAFAIERDPREQGDVYGKDPRDAPVLRELHDWKAQQLGRWHLAYEGAGGEAGPADPGGVGPADAGGAGPDDARGSGD